jgi:hypothetical protein
MGRPGLAVSAVWGFAEGSLFFVVPDVVFTLVAAFRPKRALVHIACAAAGALVAGALMFAWSAHDPESARAAVAAVPKVGTTMVERTDARLREVGARALFDRPLAGVPYKVYAVLAPKYFTLPEFLGASLLARIERFAPSWFAFALLSVAITRRVGERWRLVIGIHATFWIAVYGYYWFMA